MNAAVPAPLVDALKEHLSPDAAAMLIAYLQPVANAGIECRRGRTAQRELVALHDALLFDVLTVADFNRRADEVGV